MSVTLSQARYLIAMYHMRDRERSMTKIAKVLRVSKPSVTKMINIFIEKGMVKRRNNLVPYLTTQGRSITEKILIRHSVIKNYFNRELGIPEELAKEDALIFMFELSEKAVECFIRKIEMDLAREYLNKMKEHPYISDFKGILEEGIYEADFTLFRKADGGISMGNKGLLHPAKLIVLDGKGMISLRAVPISHRSRLGNVLKGKLARLFYWNGESYTEVDEQDGEYVFPIVDMKWNYDQDRHLDFGLVEIKVQANVGLLNMPESIANLAIYFDK